MVPIQIGGKMEFFKSFKLLSGQRVVGFFFFPKFSFSMCFVKYFGFEKSYTQSFPNI